MHGINTLSEPGAPVNYRIFPPIQLFEQTNRGNTHEQTTQITACKCQIENLPQA